MIMASPGHTQSVSGELRVSEEIIKRTKQVLKKNKKFNLQPEEPSQLNQEAALKAQMLVYLWGEKKEKQS